MKLLPKIIPLLSLIFCFSQAGCQSSGNHPKGYEQLLPRGRIAAITHPTYVPAEKATVAPNSWVLGVVIDGKPLAYSLNLLNAHEVVNDEQNGKHFAAVW